MDNHGETTVTLTYGARTELVEMRRAAYDVERNAQGWGKEAELKASKTSDSLLHALDAIVLGGYGSNVRVYRDGVLSLIAVWDSGFTLGIIWRKDDQMWTLHS